MRTLALLLPLAGCGSYWDIRKGEELPIGCAGRLNWYTDQDGDSWGDPGSSPTPMCGPDQEQKLTASNALDCDDGDAGITGMAGAICPDAIGEGESAGGSPCVQGVQSGNSEFVSTCGESPVIHSAMAEQDCLRWAGELTPESESVGATGHFGLASLETEFEYNGVVDWLTGVAGGQPMAVWVDLRWDGDLASGAWVWPDEGGIAPTWIQPCGGAEPAPIEFWPDLVPGIADDTVEESLPDLRLALVHDGSTWCRGIPEDTPFSPRDAYALCERPRPDLANYADEPDDGTTPAEE